MTDEPEKKGLLKRAVEAGQSQVEKQRQQQQELREQQAARQAAWDEQQRAQLQQAIATGAHAGFEYAVEQIRETLVGDKIDTAALARLLNERAGHGWALKQIVPASVGGRVGPGGVGGLLVVFERKLRST